MTFRDTSADITLDDAGKTHFADDDTLEYIRALKAENERLQKEVYRLEQNQRYVGFP